MPGTPDPWEQTEGGKHRLRASAGPIFGIDAHPTFQSGLLIEALPGAGFDFLSVKVSEGTAAYPSDFIPRARAVGMAVAGYHYLHPGNEDAQAQVFAQQLAANGNPAGVIDAEAIDSAGTPTLTVAGIKLFIDRCRYHGANVRLLYLPGWWWQRLGSPDLSSLDLPLWASSYPSTALGTAQQLYAAVTPDRWTAYAGLPVALLQFAETGLVPGAQADLNAFLGSREQLATLLAPITPLSAATGRRRRQEDNTMLLPATSDRIDFQIPTDVVGGWCGAANLLLTANTGGATVYGVYGVADRGPTPPLVTTILNNDSGQPFEQWWPAKWPLAAGTTSVIVNYDAPGGMVARVEYEH